MSFILIQFRKSKFLSGLKMTHQQQQGWKLVQNPKRGSSHINNVVLWNNYCFPSWLLKFMDQSQRACRRTVTGSYLGGNNERSFPHRTDHHQPISVQFWWHIHQPLWQHDLWRKKKSFLHLHQSWIQESKNGQMLESNKLVVGQSF